MRGLIVRSTGSWYEVSLEDGTLVKARIKGKMRLNKFKVTNPVAVGDWVNLELEQDEENIASIVSIEDRKNYVIRQSPRKKHYLHILAANIDQAILIITIREPKLKQGFIDRFLVMTSPYDIPVTIVFNKADLYTEEDLEVYSYLHAVYTSIGYKVLLTSATEDTGIEELRNTLTDKISMISGQSGVGKSTLVNRLQKNLELKTKELSDYTGKGQHTTTFAEMFNLEFGGKIIDTPGIKTLSYNHLEVMDIAHNFKEFFIVSEECKYNDCTHREEPKCAVKTCIENGEISELRYNNYLAILDEIEDQNYWERNTDG